MINPDAILLEGIVPDSVLDRRRRWTVFRVFNYYRLVLIGVLVGVSYLDESNRVLGATNSVIFQSAAAAYAFAVLLALVGSFLRTPPLYIQAFIQTLVDIIALSVLVYLSGGLGSNLLPLLVVAIGASSIMLPLALALTSAFLACVALLAIWLYQLYPSLLQTSLPFDTADNWLALISTDQLPTLTKIAVFSITFFIAALIIHHVAKRTRNSEQLVYQRSLELLSMANLNQAIVRHIQSGILVVDALGRIKLINDTARDQLDLHDPLQNTMLSSASQILAQRMTTWHATQLNYAKPFRVAPHLPDVSPLFSHLGQKHEKPDVLIFLEDSGEVEQRVQRIKLAALGRLTASIAHEIRNPLAAINHAAQLLTESPTGSSSDKRLSTIIHDNASRTGQIINNVLDLSRRERAKPEDIVLKSWLEEFCREFLENCTAPTPHIELRVSPSTLSVRFDAVHLHQVLWNLVTNARKHGISGADNSAHIKLVASYSSNQQRPYLDVIDSGPGIDAESQRQIFEPFFTTKTKGTGLGLYIAREICEANRSQLQYLDQATSKGGCFRITFAQSSTKSHNAEAGKMRARTGT
jgi:two-component system sensor histidine kinase PilS (NtrC family)